MAAYAAVVSLLNTVNDIQNHARLSTYFNNNQVEFLCGKVAFLQDFLERRSSGGSTQVADLEKQIARAAYAAEDLIEAHVANQILRGSTDHSNTFFLDVQKVIKDLDSITEKVMQVQDLSTLKDPKLKAVTSSTRASPIGISALVGFEDDLVQIMERLTGGQSSRQVIPIVGMGGIGKTTLARSVYEHPYIVHYFDIRIWVTISQEYTSLRDLLMQIPICQKEQEGSKQLLDDCQLGQVLYKSLRGKRYLIIMDDMWSIEAWEGIKCFFPDIGNMSRIIVTTRLSNMAICFGSYSFKVKFLDTDKSWELFCKNAFKDEVCPSELEDIGKKIVQKCKGLPLLIILIGGLMAKSSSTQEYWKGVALDINSIVHLQDEEHCSSVLSLSYSHLPTQLKPCFLYMGIFPEDHEIGVSQLIKLWIAEGFLKQDEAKSLEEVAQDCLKDLMDRNLILVGRRGVNGKIKTCYIHDLLRDLCLNVARKEEFFSVLKKHNNTDIIYGGRRIVSHGISCWSLSPFARSLVKFGLLQVCGGGFILPFNKELQLHVLKDVDVISCEDMFQQVNLRFISYKFSHYIERLDLPSSVSLLWNLQTLICYSEAEVFAPTEIWKMSQLRHVEFPNIHLPKPQISHAPDGDKCVLKNLRTVVKIVNFKFSQEVLKRIPNITKMKLSFNHLGKFMPDFCLHNLCQFEKLESLHVDFHSSAKKGRQLLQHLRLPCSLKRLTLAKFEFCWEDLAIFGCLPYLEVLKFKNSGCGIRGTEWNPTEGEFLNLKFLQVDGCVDLIYWNADSSHFPVLENLQFGNAPNLDEIPITIGEIPTLQSITLLSCKASAAISAMRILNDQESLGNDGLTAEISFKDSKEEIIFEEQVMFEGLTSNNFHGSTASLQNARLAAARIQAAFRQHSLGKQFEEVYAFDLVMKAGRDAAIKIQRAFRMKAPRDAAIKIQRAFRNYEAYRMKVCSDSEI